MSLWILLLALLLTAASVTFFTLGIMGGDDKEKRKKYYLIGSASAAAVVGIVVVGSMRGRSRRSSGNTYDYINADFDDGGGDFMDSFDVPAPRTAPAADPTALFATQA